MGSGGSPSNIQRKPLPIDQLLPPIAQLSLFGISHTGNQQQRLIFQYVQALRLLLIGAADLDFLSGIGNFDMVLPLQVLVQRIIIELLFQEFWES